MSKWQRMWRLLKQTGLKWYDDNISRMAAALAYYTLFSLAPAFVIIVIIGGEIFGEEAVKGQIVEQLQGLIGFNTAMSIQKMIEAGQMLSQFNLGNILGLAVILYAATNAFTQLKFKLNQIWGVESLPHHWVLSIFINRILSLVMVLSIGFLLLLLVFVDITLAGFNNILTKYSPSFENVYLWKGVSFFVSLIIVTGLFTLIYKFLPDKTIPWMDVLPGAALTALIFNISKFLISLYLANSQIISLFGAASSFVVILIWVNFAAQILLLGAAFCHSYSQEFGSLKSGFDTEVETF